MSTFVLVPGAWLGGWCWRDVVPCLQAGGHAAVTATLTGLGERAHLLHRETGLQTHIADIVALLHYRDLSGVFLVGHSYGGTVITAVAEQAADRVRGLIYLDGSVPQDGQSNNDVIGPELAGQIRSAADAAGDGWRVPPAPIAGWGLADTVRAWVEPRLTPHPLRSLEEPVRLRSPAAAALPRAYLRSSTRSILYGRLMDRARDADWHCCELAGGHYPMLTEPRAVASALAAVPG